MADILPSSIKTMSLPLPRQGYAAMYGPSVGDLVRLGNTDLLLEVERDYCVYGEECEFGSGKTLRDDMGQAAGIGVYKVQGVVKQRGENLRLGSQAA